VRHLDEQNFWSSRFDAKRYEMATHVSLTATTPILNQSNERNATILDGRGRLAALSVGIPQFMLSSTLPVRFALDFFARGDAASALRSRRPLCFDGRFADTPVYDGERIGHGHRVDGPAVVEERFTTLVVYPGWTAELDRHGNYVVTRE